MYVAKNFKKLLCTLGVRQNSLFGNSSFRFAQLPITARFGGDSSFHCVPFGMTGAFGFGGGECGGFAAALSSTLYPHNE